MMLTLRFKLLLVVFCVVSFCLAVYLLRTGEVHDYVINYHSADRSNYSFSDNRNGHYWKKVLQRGSVSRIYHIFDGNEIIATLNTEGRVPSFHGVKLVPGEVDFIRKNQLMAPMTLGWRFTNKFKLDINSIDVESDDDGVRLDFNIFGKSIDTEEIITLQETVLDVERDISNDSYIYSFNNRLVVLPEYQEQFLGQHKRIELLDILPYGAFQRITPTGNHGSGRKKWQYFVYQANDGEVYKVPNNHNLMIAKQDFNIAPGGFVAYVLEDDQNPVLRFKNNPQDTIFLITVFGEMTFM